MVDSEYWSYQFHFEYNNGVLQVEKGVDYPYSPIPVKFEPQYDPSQADFYGVIISVKNKENARFGFMTPTTTAPGLGKSLLSVWAPSYANADHVGFYTKTGKHLFDISVKNSSFCNDNNICDENVGENGLNCPNDCHTIPTTVSDLEAATGPIQPTIVPSIAPLPSTQGDAATSGVLTTTTTSSKIFFTPGVIIMLVGGILFVILGIILLRIRKNVD